MSNFKSLGVSDELVNTLKSQGIDVPTPIQAQAIPLLMEGKDIVAQSQTGTGKTFAFVLPILEKIDAGNPHIQALIVTPTRELALQITNEIKKLIADMEGVNILAVYGGQDVESQLKKLKKNIHIVIGTPGRLLDHIRRETVDFSQTSFLVLDEADQMLHIGFLNEVEDIIEQTPSSRQTLLFSATMPDEIRRLARRHMREPENIQIEKTQAPLANIKQIALSTIDRAKQADLIDALNVYRPFLAVIFCRTKRRVSKLYDALKTEGFNADELHGDLSQAKREQVMKRFRNADIQFLIATDVASRGLDVEGVTHVFNYDMPEDTESYIHRIGRTGRAGNEGLAISFYTPNDRQMLETIEKELKLRIEKKNIGNARKADGDGEDGGRGRRKPEHKNDSRKGRSKGGNTTARRPDRGNGQRNEFGGSREDRSGNRSRDRRGDRDDNRSDSRPGKGAVGERSRRDRQSSRPGESRTNENRTTYGNRTRSEGNRGEGPGRFTGGGRGDRNDRSDNSRTHRKGNRKETGIRSGASQNEERPARERKPEDRTRGSEKGQRPAEGGSRAQNERRSPGASRGPRKSEKNSRGPK